jgi:hypothetical protein
VPIAAFTGAPVVTVDRAARREECLCYWKSFHNTVPTGDPCVGVPPDAYAPECLRAQHGSIDCGSLFDCQVFAPNGWAECLPDEVHWLACSTCRCAKACGKDKPPCPKGQTCLMDPDLVHGQPGVGACMEP